MVKTKPCTRCATCCLLGPCAFGEVDQSTGICKWLMPNGDGSTSCYQIMLSSKARGHLLGKGCVLRNDHGLFQEALQTTAAARERLFASYDRDKNNKLISKLRHREKWNVNY